MLHESSERVYVVAQYHRHPASSRKVLKYERKKVSSRLLKNIAGAVLHIGAAKAQESHLMAL